MYLKGFTNKAGPGPAKSSNGLGPPIFFKIFKLQIVLDRFAGSVSGVYDLDLGH